MHGANDSAFIVCVNLRGAHRQTCGSVGGEAVAQALQDEMAERGVNFEIRKFRCLGRDCSLGPNVRLAPSGDVAHGVDPQNVGGLVDQLLQQQKESGADPEVYVGICPVE
ncbi:(2Fe-2S) ferredoxin domain-containing protein [Magnetofaba australis]|uniref:(2Fe-2S) ferredoxin domain-containing protein n=1 Tax=Magnetofaba australis TaxID=1472297 RepID=UPI000A19D1B9|nr:(2Fe-2S) ferredoxin domain-containing protein [Magnetofaba australis]